MNRIHLLSDHVANQIAAGEVVERPSSVLKELLENSLDAGSTQIDVLIKRGGMGLIQVQDNGSGICKEDLSLALTQHATSKIITSDDLEGVLSLGFRGEALASIAAVSKLSLSSKTEEADHGWCIQKEGRATDWTLTPTSHPTGTRLEIRELFYNTPARRKFLKSEKTEWSHVQETFKRIALSHPEVGFTLTEGDRLHKRLPACDNAKHAVLHAKRIALLCGEVFIDRTVYIEAENNGLKLKGWLGDPENSRAQSDLQYFYVNGRIVRDKVVTHAVRQAYQDCPQGRYPAYVLYFECDPMAVDVNVHPTKHEVRFREARTIHAFLSYSIQEGLGKAGMGPVSTVADVRSLPIIDNMSEQEREHIERERFVLEDAGFYRGLSKHKMLKAVKSESFDQAKPLSIFGGEFLLAENTEGLWIADIKAIRRQSALKTLQVGYDNHAIMMRPLLMPKTISIGAQMAEYELKLCDWKRLGFELDQVGPHQLLIRAVPELLGAHLEQLETFIVSLLEASSSDQLLGIIADQVAVNAQFSTEDALHLLKTLAWEEYSTLYKQISMSALRAFLYRENTNIKECL